MSFASMPLYTGDYLRDTRHLSPLRHGVYLLALMHCWDSKGPMPLDEQECAGICNCRGSDEIAAMRYVLDRYFVRMEDGHYNERITKEVERASAISSKRANAGRDGAHARHSLQRIANAKQLPDNCQAIDEQVFGKSTSPSPSPSPANSYTTPSGESVGDHDVRRDAERALIAAAVLSAIEQNTEPATASRKRSAIATGSRLPSDWILTKELGEWAMANCGMTREVVKAEADKFRDHWVAVTGAKGRKADWPATWRNWCRNANTHQARGANAESFRERDARLAAERVRDATGGLCHDRTATGERARELLPFERGHIETIEGEAHEQRRIQG